jgi:hypothetical protein
MRRVHNDRLTGLGHDHAILGARLFFRFPPSFLTNELLSQ